MSVHEQRALIQASAEGSVVACCQALELARSSWSYRPLGASALHLQLMHLLDQEYTRHSFKSALGMRDYLRLLGYPVNAKRVRRLLRLEAVHPKPRLSAPGQPATRTCYANA